MTVINYCYYCSCGDDLMSRYQPAGIRGVTAEGPGMVSDPAILDSLSGLCALLNANISLAVIYALVWISLLDLFRKVASRVEKKLKYKAPGSSEGEGREDKTWVTRTGLAAHMCTSCWKYYLSQNLGLSGTWKYYLPGAWREELH